MTRRFVVACALLCLAAAPAVAGGGGNHRLERGLSSLSCAAFGAPNGKPAHVTALRLRKGHRAYVEFRQRPSRQILPGHMYVVFGRLDANGEPLTRHYIGLDPQNYLRDSPNTPDFSVAARVQPSKRDCTYPVASAFRVSLTEKQYGRLLGRARKALSRPPRWSLERYNCHNFAADFGAIAGLRPGGAVVVPSAVYIDAFIRANAPER